MPTPLVPAFLRVHLLHRFRIRPVGWWLGDDTVTAESDIVPELAECALGAKAGGGRVGVHSVQQGAQSGFGGLLGFGSAFSGSNIVGEPAGFVVVVQMEHVDVGWGVNVPAVGVGNGGEQDFFATEHVREMERLEGVAEGCAKGTVSKHKPGADERCSVVFPGRFFFRTEHEGVPVGFDHVANVCRQIAFLVGRMPFPFGEGVAVVGVTAQNRAWDVIVVTQVMEFVLHSSVPMVQKHTVGINHQHKRFALIQGRDLGPCPQGPFGFGVGHPFASYLRLTDGQWSPVECALFVRMVRVVLFVQTDVEIVRLVGVFKQAL